MNIIDSIVGIFNPEQGLRRLAARVQFNELKRTYNAASKSRRNTSLSKHSKPVNAAQEVGKFHERLAGVSQHLVRNNPLAQRVKLILASNIMGAGIQANITGSNKQVVKEFTNFLENWMNSTECDFDNQYNFSGIMWLACAGMIESGGTLLRYHTQKDSEYPLQLQLIEQIYLDPTKDRVDADGENPIINGIEFKDGKRHKFHIDIDKTGTNTAILNTQHSYEIDKEMIHLYRKERPSQHLGVSFLAPIATHLDRYDNLQDAKVMQQKIAACLAVLVEDSTQQMGEVNKEFELTETIEPATIEYIPPGSKAHVITPPRADDSSSFIAELKNDMAVGVGLNNQQLTGDYSKFNFASGRMGLIEFNRYLDGLQNFVILPILNKIGKKLFEMWLLTRKTETTSNIKIEWIFPPRSAVNEKEEVETVVMKARNNLITPQTATKQFGFKFENNTKAWEDAYKIMGDIPFDIRPDKFSAAGNQLDEDDAASSNVKDDNKGQNNTN